MLTLKTRSRAIGVYAPDEISASFSVLRVPTLSASLVSELVSQTYAEALENVLNSETGWDDFRLETLAAFTEKPVSKPERVLRSALRLNQFAKFGRLESAQSDFPQGVQLALQLAHAQQVFETAHQAEYADFPKRLAHLVEGQRLGWVFEDIEERITQLCKTLSSPRKRPGERFLASVRLMRYLTRASLKTSPYRHQMAIGIVEDFRGGTDVQNREFSFSGSDSLSQEWLAVFRAQLRQRHSDQQRYQLTGKLDPKTGQMIYRQQHLELLRGTLWYMGQPQYLRLSPALVDALQNLAGTNFQLADLEAELEKQGLHRDKAQAVRKMLIDKAVIQVTTPPEEDLRTQLLEQGGSADLAKDKRLSGLPMSHKDAWLKGPVSPKADLNQVKSSVLATMRDLAIPSAEHRLLRDLFLLVKPRFGKSIRLSHFMFEIEKAMPNLLQKHSDPNLRPRLKDEGLCKGSGMHPFFATVQPFHENGEMKVVVNSSYENPIWLLSRYTHGCSPQEQHMQHKVLGWLRELSQETGHQFVGLSKGAALNSLQRHGAIVDRYLEGFAPAGQSGDKVLRAASCRVRLSDCGNRLVVRDEKQRPIRFLNLGSLLPLPNWGVFFWLMHLTAPVAIERPSQTAGLSGDEGRQMIRHRPREYHGDCVLVRETWYEDAQTLLNLIWAGQGAGRYPTSNTMTKIGRYFQQRNMPTQVFVSRKHDLGWHAVNSIANRHRKPQWVDIHTPTGVAMLSDVLRDCRTIQFQEVLPGPKDHLEQLDGNRRYAYELHIEACLNW